MDYSKGQVLKVQIENLSYLLGFEKKEKKECTSAVSFSFFFFVHFVSNYFCSLLTRLAILYERAIDNGDVQTLGYQLRLTLGSFWEWSVLGPCKLCVVLVLLFN